MYFDCALEVLAADLAKPCRLEMLYSIIIPRGSRISQEHEESESNFARDLPLCLHIMFLLFSDCGTLRSYLHSPLK